MKQEGLQFFTDTQYTMAALLIFFTLFCGLVLWVYRKSARNFYQKMENLPLHEGQEKHL